MQVDGNLELQSRSSTSEIWGQQWSTHTAPYGDHIILQNDGELVVFNTSESILWTSDSMTGTAPFRMIVSDDIAVYILDSANTVIWSTNPSFSKLETIWTDTFDSNNGWYLANDVTLPSNSSKCPNAPDICVKLQTEATGSWVERDTVISNYSAIQFQVDVRGFGLDSTVQPSDNQCEIQWKFPGGGWISYKTSYKNALYTDVIIDIPLHNSSEIIALSLDIRGSSPLISDECYFDNAIFRAISKQSPTKTPSNQPIASPSKHPTQYSTKPTPSPTYYPTSTPTADPSIHPTDATFVPTAPQQTSLNINETTVLRISTINPTLSATNHSTSNPVPTDDSVSNTDSTDYNEESIDNDASTKTSVNSIVVTVLSVLCGLLYVIMIIFIIYWRKKQQKANNDIDIDEQNLTKSDIIKHPQMVQREFSNTAVPEQPNIDSRKSVNEYQKCNECGAISKTPQEEMEGRLYVCILCMELNDDDANKAVDKMYEKQNEANTTDQTTNRS